MESTSALVLRSFIPLRYIQDDKVRCDLTGALAVSPWALMPERVRCKKSLSPFACTRVLKLLY